MIYEFRVEVNDDITDRNMHLAEKGREIEELKKVNKLMTTSEKSTSSKAVSKSSYQLQDPLSRSPTKNAINSPPAIPNIRTEQ
mmetsp:Transcript_7389/g.8611  ORF Transcript_7389/g.8611 Transcript_7389/m.8611 type:complete len:83 (+) Transcript_7389:499-747(+)|eukprot:CAMPEP_0198277456 /NCGR_PEP_ID=MMETSP1447-20131203/65859_1 /TAXON_ID=420782 /ORGANISM="Chaetoceros dichaeta, Strain CCMP1751" /LENGTH=82 /DNA_ID=CAMNT_0043972475 /DNA_START=479 /DNA_END=727 /DNA_ORIENTATION=-